LDHIIRYYSSTARQYVLEQLTQGNWHVYKTPSSQSLIMCHSVFNYEPKRNLPERSQGKCVD